MKCLYYGESPCIETGLAQVSKQHILVFQELGWELDAVCINHSALVKQDMLKFPFPIQTAPLHDMYNRDAMKSKILAGDYDIIFLSADCGNCDVFMDQILHMRGQKDFALIAYVPVDCDIIGAEVWRCMVHSNFTATYTYHGQAVLNRIIPNTEVNVIYLGCEPDQFFPLSEHERNRLRKRRIPNIREDTFVVVLVDRNQWRKDISRAIAAFHLFHVRHPNSVLYLHSKQVDLGGSLPEYAKVFGCFYNTPDPRSGIYEVFFSSPDFNEACGIQREEMNDIYNMANCFLKSATGEGWGLTTTEAMSAECPVLVPANTSNLEIVGGGEERGYLIKSGGMDLWLMPYGLTSNPREIISVEDCVARLERIYHNREEAKHKARRARAWTRVHTWQKFREAWLEQLSVFNR
jgi:glycosyltransferase involved in cell wall biosynthesis